MLQMLPRLVFWQSLWARNRQSLRTTRCPFGPTMPISSAAFLVLYCRNPGLTPSHSNAA